MTAPTQTIRDESGVEITVGTRVVLLGADDREYPGVVTAIGEWDADYDDDAGRGVLYPPSLTVRLDDGADETVSTVQVYDRLGSSRMIFETPDAMVAP